MPLASGTRLGPYEIVAPLGAGGMGEVYRASDPRLGREVALKVLPAELCRDTALRARFEQEARAVSALNHPNIVAIHDIGQESEILYIVTELVDGEPLRTAVSRGSIPARKLIEIAQQIADGLAAAHAAGIVHRDLKPENILLTRDGRVKIIDFGLAKQMFSGAAGVAASAQTLTMPGAVMGTIGYMSPEQIRAQTVDARTDIFSLGIILYEMAAGRSAFPGASAPDIMSAILREDPPQLQGPDLPPGLPLIVDRCLKKDPGSRFQTASDLAFAIRNLSGVATALHPSAPVPRKRSLAWMAWAVPAVCVVAGAGYWLLRPKPANPVPSPVNKAAAEETIPSAPSKAPPLPPAGSTKRAAAQPAAPKQTEIAAPVEPSPPAKTVPDKPAPADSAADSTEPPESSADTALGRAQQLNRSGKYAEAQEAFSTVLRASPNNPLAFLGRARANVQLGQRARALEDFNQAIRLRPEFAQAYIDRGHLYNLEGQYQRAMQDFNEAVRLNPQHPGAYEGRAQTKMYQGDRKGARDDRREALRLRHKK